MENTTNLSLFGYPEMKAEEQSRHANALLGLLFEKEILYQPSYTQLVGDAYAGYWLSWFVSHCRYGESIELEDGEILHQFGFTLSRWHNIRRLLKKMGFLQFSRKAGTVSYSLAEKYFSDEAGKINTPYPLIPVDRITAAAMFDKGMSITDVLVFSVIKHHLSIRDSLHESQPDENGHYSIWQDHDDSQRANMSEWPQQTVLKCISNLYQARLLQVVLDKERDMLRYRIDYDAYGNLTYAYVHQSV